MKHLKKKKNVEVNTSFKRMTIWYEWRRECQKKIIRLCTYFTMYTYAVYSHNSQIGHDEWAMSV